MLFLISTVQPDLCSIVVYFVFHVLHMYIVNLKVDHVSTSNLLSDDECFWGKNR